MDGFTRLANGVHLEGLAVDNARNIVWFSDAIAGGVFGLMPDGTIEPLNPARQWCGGLMLNADGAVLSSGQGGIMWNHPESGESGWLIHEIDGVVINGVNEMMPDGEGGLYFGTIDIDNLIINEPFRPASLYRLTADREVIKLVDGLVFTNGMMLSAKRDRFYANDSFNCTYAFDVQPDLSLVNQRQFLDKDDADGMALDAEGNIWITGFRSSSITRVQPDGSLLPAFETPAEAVTQIRFGGADMRDCYITAVPANVEENLKEGVGLTEKHSFLYRGRSDVPGMPITPTTFKLA